MRGACKYISCEMGMLLVLPQGTLKIHVLGALLVMLLATHHHRLVDLIYTHGHIYTHGQYRL